MALILNIDTSVNEALVSLARDEKPLRTVTNAERNDHAAWIQNAIHSVIAEGRYHIRNLDAVGITIGPGSYTGLRIGLSTAKGLCYALKVPMITVGTLQVLAFSAIEASNIPEGSDDLLFCPLIDARRMEVFTAIYDSALEEIIKPHAHILSERSFSELLHSSKILFLGNGSIKFQMVCKNSNALFKNIPLSPVALAKLIYRNFIGNNFAALAYTEPLYIKEFFTRKDTKPANKSEDH